MTAQTRAARAARAYLADADALEHHGLTAHLLAVAYPEPPPLLVLPACDPRTYRCACWQPLLDRGPSHLPACPTHHTSRLLDTDQPHRREANRP